MNLETSKILHFRDCTTNWFYSLRILELAPTFMSPCSHITDLCSNQNEKHSGNSLGIHCEYVCADALCEYVCAKLLCMCVQNHFVSRCAQMHFVHLCVQFRLLKAHN